MFQEQTPTISETQKRSVDEIVRAAYKKFARDKLTRKAMKLTFSVRGERRSVEPEDAAP